MGKQETLETIWGVPDELWERIEPIILEEDPPKARGRKRSDPRQMLNGIIFRLRSGCQWNRLPKELGDDSTIHRTFQRWVGTGVLHRMWGACPVNRYHMGVTAENVAERFEVNRRPWTPLWSNDHSPPRRTRTSWRC